jgi:hypothetical protein
MKDDIAAFIAAIQQNHKIVDITGIIDRRFFRDEQIAVLIATAERNNKAQLCSRDDAMLCDD